MIKKQTAIVYIDGFNFYYGVTRHTKYKWCDLVGLFEGIYPEKIIVKVKLFSGKSLSLPLDTYAPKRQNVYFRALRLSPRIELILSDFRKYTEEHPLSEDLTKKVKVEVLKEKQSDVNLATHLIIDAFENKFECAIVATNDIDFIEPIKKVRYKLGKQVYLVPTNLFENDECDCKRFVAKELLKYSTNHRIITTNLLSKNQFPDTLKDQKGTFQRPDEWR